MSEEKPFGWRPLTAESRAHYRGLGWSEEQIADFEKTNAYTPDETAVVALHLGGAILSALAKVHGAEFVHGVRSQIERKAGRLASSDAIEDKVESAIMQRFAKEIDWEAIIRRASEGLGEPGT